jgi:hypothetical protein
MLMAFNCTLKACLQAAVAGTVSTRVLLRSMPTSSSRRQLQGAVAGEGSRPDTLLQLD